MKCHDTLNREPPKHNYTIKLGYSVARLLRCTATLYIPPQIAVSKQWRYIGVLLYFSISDVSYCQVAKCLVSRSMKTNSHFRILQWQNATVRVLHRLRYEIFMWQTRKPSPRTPMHVCLIEYVTAECRRYSPSLQSQHRYSRTNSIKSPSSGAGNVSEPWLMS